jgi:hypothetical protein
MTMVFSSLKKCYNAWSDVRTATKAGADSDIIRSPAPSVIGAGTPESFFRALKSKDLESGFINRMVVLPFEGNKKPPEKIRTASPEPPKELLDRLRQLPQLHGVMDEIGGSNKLPPPLPIGWADDGAIDVYLALSKKLDAIQEGDDENRRDLSQRVCENAIRIATIIAVGRGASAVARRDIEFAIDLCERSFDAVVNGVEKFMFELYQFPRLVERAFTMIDAVWPGILLKRDLKRAFRNNQSWGNELDRACKYLEEEERVEYFPNVGDSNRRSPGYRSIRSEESKPSDNIRRV